MDLTEKEIKTIRIIYKYYNDFLRIPTVRELMKELDYRSPRSASLIFQSLLNKGFLKKDNNGKYKLDELNSNQNKIDRTITVNIPLLGNIACGLPILAEENIETQIPIAKDFIKDGYQYFILRAVGDSMNLSGINDGDLLLIKQQVTAQNGDLVVALIDDEATVKEFIKRNDIIILKPNSDNEIHQPIILTSNFRIQGIVEKIISI